MNRLCIKALRTLVRITPAKPLGYRVSVRVLPPKHDVWEGLTHTALFASPGEAHRLADRLEAADGLNLENWVWTASAESCLPPLRFDPTATLQEQTFVPDF